MRVFGVSVALTALALSATAAHGDQRGVTANEIVLGTHTALTGPVAPWGTGSVNGMRMLFDEMNAKGGINGRKVKLIVEDHSYLVPKAIQAANKLLNRDKIFAMLAALGTPMNNAVLPKQLEAGVINFGPFTAARQMVEPYHKLKFLTLSTYYSQIRSGVKYFIETKGKKRICAMYQDSDFGREVLNGTEDQLKAMGMKLTASSAHNPREQTFTGAVIKLRKAGCDLVVMGTIIRDSIIPFVTAKKIGWKGVDFLGSVATYDMFIAAQKGGIMNGFHAMTSFEMIYPDSGTPAQKAWAARYMKKFGKMHTGAVQLGYMGAELFAMIAQKAGKNLTADTFIQAAESIKGYQSELGGAKLTFGPNDHLGATDAFLAVVENGRWKTLSDAVSY